MRGGPRRRGVVLWLVLTLVVVLGMMFFSFHLSVRQRNAQAHAAYFGAVAHSLAQSGVNLAFHELRGAGETEGSPLWTQLVEAEAGGLPGTRPTLDLGPYLEKLTAGLGEDLDLEVEVEVLAAEPLVPEGEPVAAHDPVEKRILLEVRARGEFRGMVRNLAEQRELRVQLDALPVLNRFTLFVRAPETGGAGDLGYNRFANDINGAIDAETVAARENFLPLLLFNHGDSFPSLHHDLAENGWVYLGGRRPVQLNLTSGADYQYGQYFHFYDFLAADTSRQAAFLAEAPPAFFRSPRPGPGGETHQYYLKHVIYGFFTRDRGTPPGDMNRGGVLDLALAREPNQRSSVLHLFGSTLSPSPTRVFGPVYHAYPIYTGVTVDVDGDGRRDGVVKLAPSKDAAGYALLDGTNPLPSRVRHIGRPGETISLDPAVTWTSMFPDYATYEAHMSALVTREPYNAGVDYMFARGEFPPQEKALDPGADYPNPGSDVRIALRDGAQGAGPGAAHFEGDLADVDAEFLRPRAVLEFPDQEAFKAAFLHPGGVLRMGRPVRILAGDLELPEELYVEEGGLLMAEGSIFFDGVRCRGGERLSLVSLGGSVTSPFDRASPDRPVEADLVALQGRVASTEPTHPMSVFGTVAAERLRATDFQAGGQLVYDRAADPTAPGRRELARVHLSDRPLRWRL